MKRIVLYLLILNCITGCGGFAVKEKIIDNYYLIALDETEQMSLDYIEEEYSDILGGTNYPTIINSTVFGVGFNDKYMIIEQHPRVFPYPCDKSITNYYILPIKKGMNWRTKNGLIGPLSKDQFNQKRKELNIENISFTHFIKDFE